MTDSKLKLEIIIVSTRPSRAGLPIGQWFSDFATQHGAFEIILADLAELDLPMMDEPNHPVQRRYTKEHTKNWSAIVEQADAYVFVMPEYDYGVAAPMVNAIDYLFVEWNYKPVGMVSYGGISGGLRAQQMAKLLFTGVKMMPIPESVPIPFFSQYMKEGIFAPDERVEKSAKSMLDELRKWAEALKRIRA